MTDSKQKRKRVMVDITKIQDDINDYWEVAGIDQDVWEAMPDPQKMLLLAQRGITAAKDALNEAKEQ